MKDAPRRIVIFNVNWLGDVLFSTAVIRNLRRNFPKSFLACIIPSRCYPILKDNSYLDEIIIFDQKDRHKGILKKVGFIRNLKNKKFDLAILLHRSFTRALILKLAGIPRIIGYRTNKRGFLLSEKIIPPAFDSLHRIDYYLNVIEKAGIRVEDRYTDFFFNDQDLKFVDDFLKVSAINKNYLNKKLGQGEDFLIGINAGGNWPLKRWPKEYWAVLADRLIDEFEAKVIITGSLEDVSLAKEIKGLMKNKPIIACGVFNLKQLGAICKRLDLFISADSGPMHIANSVGTKKIIALFGPTSPLVTGPYPTDRVTILSKDIGCKIPCYLLNCKDNRCMKAITPEEVIEKIKSAQ